MFHLVVDQARCGQSTAAMDDTMRRGPYSREPVRFPKFAEHGIGVASREISAGVRHFLQPAITSECRQTNR